jgi:hypothetical protein
VKTGQTGQRGLGLTELAIALQLGTEVADGSRTVEAVAVAADIEWVALLDVAQ